MAIVGTVALLAVVAALALREGEHSRRPPEQPAGQAQRKAEQAAQAPGRKLDFGVLVGRWERTDTPYVIEIRETNAEGKLKAAYFNPQPINVSRAEAGVKDGTLTVFVELRDTNYPGCTYKLAYDRDTDALAGTYYQAALQQEFEIAFARVKEK